MCHPEVPAGQQPPVVDEREVSLPALDGTPMPGLLTVPAETPAPGILVIPDIWGRSPFYEALAARVAQAGFYGLLVDQFFRVGGLESREQVMERRSKLDDHQAIADLSAAAGWLRAQPEVSGDRVGTVGFCMGGTFVLNLAAERSDVATVCYYGFPAGSPHPIPLCGPKPLDQVDQISGPLLGLWGEDDPGVGMDNVERFVDALRARNVEIEHHIYEGVGHGFMARSELEPGADGYDQACDSWARALDFWRRTLR